MVTSRQRCECHAGLTSAYKYIYLSIFTLHFGATREPAPLPSPEGWAGRCGGLSWSGGAGHGVAWGAGALPCFLEAPQPLEPHFCPSLSVPVLGWGGGRGTLLGINLTLWILLLSCLFPPGEGPALGPQLCSPWFTSLGLVKLRDGVWPALTGTGCLGSTLSLPLNPWVTLDIPLSLLGPGVNRLGMWGGAPCSGPSPLVVMIMGAFHWGPQTRLPRLEPRQSLVTSVSPSVTWQWY